MSEPVHYQYPDPKDSRVAACSKYWCNFNSADWNEVTCEECLAIRDRKMVRQVLYGGDTVDRPAFYGHARKEWVRGARRYVNTVRTEGEQSQ